MKENLSQKLKQRLVKTYRKFGDETALLIKGGKSYTGFQVAEEIEKETEDGLSFMYNMLGLAIDLTKRDKINQDEHKEELRLAFEAGEKYAADTYWSANGISFEDYYKDLQTKSL